MSGVLENSEKLAEIKAKRKTKLDAFDAAAKSLREENEIKLGEYEDTTGKTLGIDLANIFTPSGKMIVVQKPPAVVHNKLMLAQTNHAVDDALVCEYCAAVIVIPSAIEAEKIYLEYANARDAVVNAGIQLAAVDQSNLLGK